MGVAILQPEDCPKLPNPMKHRKSFCPNTNRSNRAQHPNRKKRSPITSPPPSSAVPKIPAKNLVMGQVKILKRGEELKELSPSKSVKLEKKNVDADSGFTNRLDSAPVSAPTQNRLNESNNNNNEKVITSQFYAGSVINIKSPPPSSVPMPAFFTKKVVDATTDLRRILKLDL